MNIYIKQGDDHMWIIHKWEFRNSFNSSILMDEY